MKLWLQILLEWINCLDVSEINMKDIKDLESGKIYEKLLELCSWTDTVDISDTENIVTKFLQDKYPEIACNTEALEEMDHISIMSLLMSHICQFEPSFHQSMCNKLQPETQMKIKMFLEMVIPYGSEINSELLNSAILELQDNLPKTPVTPRGEALKDFLNTPVTKSARSYKLLKNRSREIRKLMNELEMERFEKADLQEEVKIQHEKVKSLQKRLEEKTTQLRALRNERIPKTPQSSKKGKNTEDCEYYRKAIDSLEEELMQKQSEIDKLETENSTLSKKLIGIERECKNYKDKLDTCEKFVEDMRIQGEIRDRELTCLKTTNEELQAHLKNLNRLDEERSFEIDDIVPLNLSSAFLNTSEALSTVVEIQLQEAKEESASLKSHINGLNKKLESTNHHCQNITQLLEETTTSLQDTEAKLNATTNTFTKEIEILQTEKTTLINQNRSLESTYASQKNSLLQMEETKNNLIGEVGILTEKVKELEQFLQNEKASNKELNDELTEAKTQICEHVNCIKDLTHQNDVHKKTIECCEESIIRITEKLGILLHYFDEQSTSQQARLESLNNTMEEMKFRVQLYKSQIYKLEEKDKQSVEEISNWKAVNEENITKIDKLNNTVQRYSNEISSLKEVQLQKETLEKELVEKLSKMEKQCVNEVSKLKAINEENIQQYSNEISSLKEVQLQKETLEKELVEKLSEMEKQCFEEVSKLKAMNEENIQQYSNEISSLKDVQLRKETLEKELVGKLAEMEKQSVETGSKWRAINEENLTTINKLNNTVQQYSNEISSLKEVQLQKETLEKELVEKLSKMEKQSVETASKWRAINEENITTINKLNNTIQQYSNEISSLKEVQLQKETLEKELVGKLAEMEKQSVETGSKWKAINEENLTTINKLKNTVQQYSNEISSLKEVQLQKESLEKELVGKLSKMEKQSVETASKWRAINEENITTINKLNNTIQQYSNEISSLKEVQLQKETLEKELVGKLAEMEKQSVETGSKWKAINEENLTTINKLKNTVQQYSNEISSLKEVQLQKESLEKELVGKLAEMEKQSVETASKWRAINEENITTINKLNNTVQQYSNEISSLKEVQLQKETLEKELVGKLAEMEKQSVETGSKWKAINEENLTTINKLKNTVQQYSNEISSLKEVQLQKETLEKELVEKLAEMEKQSVNEISKLKAINEENIQQYSKEISSLKDVQLRKEILEKELYARMDELNEKNELLKSSVISMKNLKENFNAFVTEFCLTKNNVLSQLNECSKQNTETVNNILNTYKTMSNNFTREQNHRKEVEDKLDNNEKELKNIENLNTSLKNNLAENEQVVSVLEAELTKVKKELKESVRETEDLQKAIETLEKEKKNMKSQNEKVLFDLHVLNENLKLSQENASDVSNQLKIRDEKIVNLIEEISSLKLKETQIIHLQKEEVLKLEIQLSEKQRDLDELKIQIKTMQETLELAENKFEKSSKEAAASEVKMKEIIMNLQEVRTTQDALLNTQEKALKERNMEIDQLQKEFNEKKSKLCKQLEDEKSLSQSLQSKNAELQIQLYKQNKTINELQEVLKREKEEHERSKEYCKDVDTKNFEIVQVCNELEHSINDLKLIIAKASPTTENFYSDNISDASAATGGGDATDNILNIVRISINETRVSRKLISYLSNVNISLNEILENQKHKLNDYVKQSEEIELLKNQVHGMKSAEEKHVKHLTNLIDYKESLKDSLQGIAKLRKDLDTSLDELKQKWDNLVSKSHNTLANDKSACDELKNLQAKKSYLENTLSQYNICHLKNIMPMHDILWGKFLWTENILKNTYLNSTRNEEIPDILSNTFLNEKAIIETELQKCVALEKDIDRSKKEIDDFSKLILSLEDDLKSDETKFRSELEKKLQSHIDELVEEKNDIVSKLECARVKNARLEVYVEELKKNLDESETTLSKQVEVLEKSSLKLKEDNLKLQEERDELIKRPKKEDVDVQIREIYEKYKTKLDEIKQNMKTAYHEQLSKLHKEQEQDVQEKLELLQRKMGVQCRKQADELSQYKAHVATVSSQLWDVGEKLLSERQEKEKLQKQLNDLKAKHQHMDQKMISAFEYKVSKFEKKDVLSGDRKEETLKVAIVQENTDYERRCSIRSIQSMGNAFNPEDEEGEIFNNIYLADMKSGGHHTFNTDTDRLSTLQKRNALCKPHLKSSYPAETQCNPLPFTEEEIKSGSVPEDVFNDSLSQSLLPEQKARKKDKTQTSYKKPGPPTPSRNGGRLSLQGNSMKSPTSRILKERNSKDRSTSTPRTLKSLFISRRQDENSTVTPRGRRRSSIFRR